MYLFPARLMRRTHAHINTPIISTPKNIAVADNSLLCTNVKVCTLCIFFAMLLKAKGIDPRSCRDMGADKGFDLYLPFRGSDEPNVTGLVFSLGRVSRTRSFRRCFMKLFIAMNLRYKGQVIGTLPDYEHFEARDQKEADEIAKSAGWDKAIEVTQKISGAAQAPLVVGQPASERLMKALDNRRLDEPKPSRLQVAMVLHALADHTAIMEMLKHRPDETSPWKEATSVGRWFHDVGDQLEDA